jgi:hypothetical protein
MTSTDKKNSPPVANHQILALEWYCETSTSSLDIVIAREWLECLKNNRNHSSLGSYLKEKSIYLSIEHRLVLITIFLAYFNYNLERIDQIIESSPIIDDI